MELSAQWIEKTPAVSAAALQQFLMEVCAIGPRWPGTPAEEQSIRLLERRLGETCDRVELEEFPYAHYTPLRGSMELRRPVHRSVACAPLQYARNAAAEGELLYVGEGRPKDFQALQEAGVSARGRIVVACTNRPYVAGRIAAAEGAAAIVIISDSPFGTIRQVTSQMGYEKGEDLAGFGVGLPGVIVNREDGDTLLSLASSGGVEARVEHAGTVQPRQSYNVIGYRYGKEETGRQVVIGAHYDTQLGIQGAWDNGSGCAALLEIARACRQTQPRRTMVFCGFGGEEIGLFGSTGFVQRREKNLGDIVCYVNLDSTSGDVPYTHELHTTEDVKDFAFRLVSEHTGWKITHLRSFTPFDHEQDSAEFVKRGVNAIWAHEEGNAFFHTAYDTLETVSAAKLARAARVSLLPFFYLSQAAEVPF
jgi:Iap family predicted aminopeptidase